VARPRRGAEEEEEEEEALHLHGGRRRAGDVRAVPWRGDGWAIGERETWTWEEVEELIFFFFETRWRN
jgi:hypothetical protein